ncbi:MAG: GPP34 family phosphoprotein [Alphaproteobacteria bacterium]|nr:GPP34 family phosphoprotein [Alphaproteobacteria bacterium]
MLRFAEEMMLLLLDDEGGKFIDVPTVSLEHALAGSVLMDLALERRIDTDPKQLFVIDPTPTGDDLLDPTLARIVQAEETHDCGHWIKASAVYADEIRERALDRRVERGVLRREEDRFMWVLPTRRYPIIDNKTVREVKLRIMEVLFSDEIPDARDIIIISLSDVCGILRSLLSSRELKTTAQRVDQVRKMDLIGREVSETVWDIQSSLAMAMVPMH